MAIKKSARTPVKKSTTKPVKSVKLSKPDGDAPGLIDQRIREVGGWRGKVLARMRGLILAADPRMTEQWKWGVPVWSHEGIVCTGETYTKVVKLTFPKGASVPNPSGLFNSSLAGNTRRAIDIGEGDEVDARAFKALVKAAVALNGGAKPKAPKAKAPKLLSGGNPQIAKGYGDAPVQAYIAAMPGWKRGVGHRLDALIEGAVPGVSKAVKWNSPFYGVEDHVWFLSFHCFTRYVKVTFFRGASLRPVPPGESRQKDVRYLDIREDDQFDEAQFADWVKQASLLPGERM